MSEPVWMDPPETRGGRRDNRSSVWPNRLEPLRAHPKRWALVTECATSSTAQSTASRLRHGFYKQPSGKWEFVQRKIADDRFGIFARYLGPEDEL